MKKSIKLLLPLLSFLSFLCFFSCSDVGLGEEVDLEAPVLTVKGLKAGDTEVENFEGGVYCKKNVTFYGTATDNSKVSRVYAQLKWSDETEFTDFATATLSGTEWTLDVEFEKESSCYIKIIAEDPAKNMSIKSSKTITLFIDESAPVASGWYIDRQINGITYNLQTKEKLESLDLDLPENKDAAQNVAFTVCATATDLFGIQNVSIQIRDEKGNKIATISKLDSSNEYAPKFEVTHDILVKGDSSLATGKHYLQLYYDSEDIVVYPESNKNEDVEVELGWFLWWPESDNPRIVLSDSEADVSSDDTLNVYINDLISFSVFDDDSLDEAYFALLTESELKSFGSIDWDKIAESPSSIIQAVKADSANSESSDEDAREKRSCIFTADTERDATISLFAATKPQTMTLLAIAWDKTDKHLSVTKEMTVRVTDDSTPMLLISSPKNNSIPALGENNVITIEGQTLDAAGCTYLEFAYVSQSSADQYTEAKNYLETINTEDAHNTLANATNRVTSTGNLKIWSVPLTEDGASGSFYKHKFSFDISLLKDFDINGTNEKAFDKYFLIKLTRKDGNYIYQEYTLSADNLPPTIYGIMPSVDMQIVSNEDAVTFKFYAKKESDLEIDTSAYKIERVDVSNPIEIKNGEEGFSNVGYNKTSGYYEATLSKTQIESFGDEGTKPKYRFYAKDVLGNEGSTQYTIVISELPMLKSISTSASNMCKLGDEIDIVASFSKTVSVSQDLGTPRLKLRGITNSTKGIKATDTVYADYVSGSETTNIHFKYTVQEGDSSTGLCLFGTLPIDDNDSLSFTSDKVTITALTDSSNLIDSKSIQIDGIKPSVSGVVFTTNGVINSGISYLKEGSAITTSVTVSELVIVQGSPTFIFDVGSGNIALPFTGVSGSGTNTKITFGKTVTTSDINGSLKYAKASCISDMNTIVDSFGNELVFSDDVSALDAKITIDTVAPLTPACSATYGGSSVTLTDNAKFKDSVSFTLSKKEADSTIKWIQYSVDGGSNWLPNNASAEGSAVKLTDAASFTYRAVDYAGNVSDIPNPIYIDVESSFPAFTVECTNADGNYKVGSTLNFNVNFARPVNVAANSGAYITLSGNGSSDKGGGKATISSTAKQSEVYTVSFVYTVTSSDDFTLKVAQNAVTLSGITDEYGISQGSKTLSSAYVRTNVHCDGIVPSVSSMTHQDDTTANTTDNVIVLNFNENVIKSSGFITLRRAGDWALPPVLSGTDFKKISNAVSEEQKNILSLQENDTDMEDSEWVNGSTADYENKYYHGTGQFVGPYKKTTQGITEAGEPDVETKYVLDFDMGIWETDTPHYYGKTFKSSTQTSPTTLDASNATTITANKIRDVLKAAGYDKRVVDVTSSNVKVDGKTVTITFPAGLCDKTASLPKGINWEIEVDDGTFIDESGNSMSSYTNEFVSSGVSTPVVRVDRYSYGLGIYQATSAGGKSIITGDSTVPTGYVRVRIDCETSDVTIKYANVASTVSSGSTTTPDTKGSTSTYYNYKAITKDTLKGSSLNQYYSSVLGVGDGKYNTAFRKYIVAQAEKSGQEPSELGYEGILQTVVEIVNPKQKSGYEIYQMTDAKYAKVSIRGTTSWSGEPSISPFPLRDAQIGSPFLRLCFREKSAVANSNKYYWVSYEVLVDTSYSGHARTSSSWDYIGGWGYVSPGGLSTTSDMKTEH